MTALPDKKSANSKKKQVEEMFDNISDRYDLLNHLLSANIDKLWRSRVVKMLRVKNPGHVLDIATGTADFALAAAKIENIKITGIDISEGMLTIGREKVKRKGLENRIILKKADSENLPFEPGTFDAAIVGFGVRNFENLQKGLSEIYRVLKPGGEFFVLEFSKPSKTPIKQFYNLYFNKVLPFVGGLISRNRNAYTYLPDSVNEFPDGVNFLAILAEAGFVDLQLFEQTFGIATIYKACKQ